MPPAGYGGTELFLAHLGGKNPLHFLLNRLNGPDGGGRLGAAGYLEQPGVIGAIGSILGKNGLNIAAMQWSRNRRGEKAVAFVSVDGEVNDAILNQMGKLEGVLKATMLRLQ